MASVVPAYASYEFMRVTSPSEFVAHLELNRPGKLNAFSRAVWLEFGRVFRQLSDDSDVRVVVLSGAGDRAFTAGLDLTAASSEGPMSGAASDADPARRAKAWRAHVEEFQACISEMEKCEKRTCYGPRFHGVRGCEACYREFVYPSWLYIPTYSAP